MLYRQVSILSFRFPSTEPILHDDRNVVPPMEYHNHEFHGPSFHCPEIQSLRSGDDVSEHFLQLHTSVYKI